jgi:hypothetical protein
MSVGPASVTPQTSPLDDDGLPTVLEIGRPTIQTQHDWGGRDTSTQPHRSSGWYSRHGREISKKALRSEGTVLMHLRTTAVGKISDLMSLKPRKRSTNTNIRRGKGRTKGVTSLRRSRRRRRKASAHLVNARQGPAMASPTHENKMTRVAGTSFHVEGLLVQLRGPGRKEAKLQLFSLTGGTLSALLNTLQLVDIHIHSPFIRLLDFSGSIPTKSMRIEGS